jgi:hypothetical protein
MRRSRNPNQKRGSKIRQAQAALQREINASLAEGMVIRDLDGNPVISSNLDTFSRLQNDANRNPGNLFGTLEKNPELAETLLATQKSRHRKNVTFLKKEERGAE